MKNLFKSILQIPLLRTSTFMRFQRLTLLLVCILAPFIVQARELPWIFPIDPAKLSRFSAVYGAMDTRCVNAPREHDALIYNVSNDPKIHLGIDLAAPPGTLVHSVADGVVLNEGALWGPDWRDIILVKHMTTEEQHITVVYGHIETGKNPTTNRKWKEGDLVKIGSELGTIADMKGSHLHLGVAHGSKTHVRGMGDPEINSRGHCKINPFGTMDPAEFFMSTPTLATIPYSIVRGAPSLGRSPSGAWYVNFEQGRFIRYAIPSSSQVRCIQRFGVYDWGEMPERFMDQFDNYDSRVAWPCE